jgi:hypothetical protein
VLASNDMGLKGALLCLPFACGRMCLGWGVSVSGRDVREGHSRFVLVHDMYAI